MYGIKYKVNDNDIPPGKLFQANILIGYWKFAETWL